MKQIQDLLSNLERQTMTYFIGLGYLESVDWDVPWNEYNWTRVVEKQRIELFYETNKVCCEKTEKTKKFISLPVCKMST